MWILLLGGIGSYRQAHIGGWQKGHLAQSPALGGLQNLLLFNLKLYKK
jgi:hypothetical protein